LQSTNAPTEDVTRVTDVPWSNVGRDSAIYALGGLAGRAGSVLLLPILARALGPEDFGRFDLVGTLGSALTVIFILGLDTASTRLFFDQASPVARKRLVSTWLVVAMAVGIAVGATMFLLAPVIAGTLLQAPGSEGAVRWLALVVPAGIANAVSLNVIRLSARPPLYASLSAAVLLLNAGLAIAAVGPLQLGITGAIAAWAISLVLISSVGLAASRSMLTAGIDRSAAISLLRFGLPLVPALLIVWSAEVVNRTILLQVGGADAVGRLSVALRISSLIALAGTAFLLAWHPRVFARGHTEESLQRAARESSLVLIGGAALVVATTAAAPLLVTVLGGAQFRGSIALVGPLALAALATALLQAASIGSVLMRRSADLSIALAIGAVVGVGGNALLAPVFGESGTASALVIGQGAGLAVMVTLARRRLPISYDFFLAGAASGIALAAVVLIALVADQPAARLIFAGAAVCLIILCGWLRIGPDRLAPSPGT
jgi:O-antigen/teichoic acid export membrane protein